MTLPNNRNRKLVFLTVVVTGVVGALAIQNETIRRSRTIYIVNNTGVPAQVRVDQNPPLTVNQRTPITLPEGEHEIQISGPLESNEKLVVASGYFARWFRRPVWLINVNGEAVILQDDISYSASQSRANPHFHVGETSLAFSHVDYLFDEQPPEKMSVRGNRTLIKSRLRILDVAPETIVSRLADHNLAGVLTSIENRLARLPESNLLDDYCRAAQSYRLQERAATFLESRLDVRPINVAWHRAYQNLRDTEASAAAVVARYQKVVQNEPDSAAAWYLFARHDRNLARAERSLAKALELDPQMGWALYYRANRALNLGHWEQAEHYFTAALASPAPDDAWHQMKIYSLLAQQKYDAVDEECNRWPSYTENATLIAIVRLWSKRMRKLPVDIKTLSLAALRQHPADLAPESTRLYLETYLNSAAGNWDALRRLYQNPLMSIVPPQERALQLLSTLSAAELKASFPEPSAFTNGADMLAVALAFALVGAPEDAARWGQQAIELCRQGSYTDRELAHALEVTTPMAIGDFRDHYILVNNRSLVCAWLAQQFPGQREKFLAEARVWQLLPLRYYWIVELALEQIGERQP